jgi:hypothetical protein
LDKSGPTIVSANDGQTYTLNSSQTTTFACTDPGTLSGVNSCVGSTANGSTLPTSPVGPHTYTVNASDNAGNTSSKTVSYSVNYRWDGFLQPINDTAHTQLTMSIFKSGSTVPVKFQLKDANGNSVQAATLPVWVTPQNVGTTSAPIDETVYTDQPTSGTTFRWDATGQQYIYNWQTPKNPGQVWRICARFDDGQQQCVNIGLK